MSKNNFRRVLMLFAILVGGSVALIINRQNTVRADGLETGVTEAGCYGDDSRKCFTEEVGGRIRTYYGEWQERRVY